MPEDFGLIAIVHVVINAAVLFQDAGLTQALIYQKDAERASGTAFWLIITFAVGIFLVVLWLAPALTTWLGDSRASPILQIMSVKLVITAAGAIPAALLMKQLDFKRKTIVEVVSSVGYSLTAVGLAWLGLKVWSIAWGQIIQAIIYTFLIWHLTKWRLNLDFNWSLARKIMAYGKDIFGTQILAYIYFNLDDIFIARILGAKALGAYTLAFWLGTIPVTFAAAAIAPVLFPSYVQLREDFNTLRRIYLKSLRLTSLFAFPANLGLLAVASPFVLTLYGEKWAMMIVPLQILTIYGVARALGGPLISILKAIGKQRLPLLFTVAYDLLAISLMGPAIYRWEIAGVSLVMSGIALAGNFIMLLVVNRYLALTAQQLITNLLPQLIASVIMAIAVFSLGLMWSPSLPSLILSVGTGIIIYTLLMLLLTKGNILSEMQDILQSLLTRQQQPTLEYTLPE